MRVTTTLIYGKRYSLSIISTLWFIGIMIITDAKLEQLQEGLVKGSLADLLDEILVAHGIIEEVPTHHDYIDINKALSQIGLELKIVRK